MEKNWPASGAWRSGHRCDDSSADRKLFILLYFAVEQRTICFPQHDFSLILFTVSPSAMYSTSFWVHVEHVCASAWTVESIIMCCSYRYWRLALPQIETLVDSVRDTTEMPHGIHTHTQCRKLLWIHSPFRLLPHEKQITVIRRVFCRTHTFSNFNFPFSTVCAPFLYRVGSHSRELRIFCDVCVYVCVIKIS